jgi:mannose-6-phosphate isomerase-like protein (cupin superfamily)
MSAFDPLATFVHLPDGPDARLLEVGPDFWQKLETRRDLHGGRLVSAYRFTEDWTSWERHPAGDELVFQLSGAMDFVLDDARGERTVALRGRAAVVVPRGVWHTARVRAPSEAIFVTRGEGTEHRPLEKRGTA